MPPLGETRGTGKNGSCNENGKHAVTGYRVLRRFQDYTWLELKLETGRTHQIRVHLSFIGHPLVGDQKHGPARSHFNLNGQFLHAAVLGFSHPRKGTRIELEAPLPGELAAVLQKLTPEDTEPPGE